MNQTSALIKKAPDSFLIPSTIRGYSEKTTACELGSRSSRDTESASTLIILMVYFPASRAVRNKFLSFISLSVYGIFVTAAEWTIQHR